MPCFFLAQGKKQTHLACFGHPENCGYIIEPTTIFLWLFTKNSEWHCIQTKPCTSKNSSKDIRAKGAILPGSAPAARQKPKKGFQALFASPGRPATLENYNHIYPMIKQTYNEGQMDQFQAPLCSRLV